MLVFIDESGCSGFKLTRGSNAVFAIGMVIFDDAQCAIETERCIEQIRARLGHKPEFKFSKCSDRVRDGFFEGVVKCPFRVRALVVQKQRIHSPQLRTHGEEFYSFFVKQLIKHDNNVLQNAAVRLDGSGDREFRRALKGYLRRELRAAQLTEFRMVDSRRDQLMQLADMCVGAIARAYRERDDAERWLKVLRPRVTDIWEFK